MDYFDILLAKKLSGGGGDITVEGLSVTENATYTAPEGKAYSPVVVNVPLPSNAYLKETASTYPIAPSLLPLPKAEVTFEGNKAELYVGSEPIVVDTDNTPYVYRQSPSGMDRVVLNSLVGGTVAWNQLVQNGNFADTSGWSATRGSINVSNNECAYTISELSTHSTGNRIARSIIGVTNHKYLAMCDVKLPYSTNFRCELIGSGQSYSNYVPIQSTNTYVKFATVISPSVNVSIIYLGIDDSSGSGYSVGDTIKIKNANLFDLTQAFGSTIADYVYSLEQATAGSGIAWLKSYGFLTKDYYAYQSGKLESVNVASRKVYDSNNTLLATYNFDATKVLRGIPKLDANNNLYYDGDTYESDGSVKRKYGVRAYESGDESLTDAITDGTNTVYKLTTPTTEQALPFTNPQLVGSTEEFIDAQTSASTPTRDVDIPCGQDSNYANSDIYISYGTSPIDMAKEHSIVPYASTYIESNGSEVVEYWKK